jgi:hypothetical protein
VEADHNTSLRVSISPSYYVYILAVEKTICPVVWCRRLSNLSSKLECIYTRVLCGGIVEYTSRIAGQRLSLIRIISYTQSKPPCQWTDSTGTYWVFQYHHYQHMWARITPNRLESIQRSSGLHFVHCAFQCYCWSLLWISHSPHNCIYINSIHVVYCWYINTVLSF